MYSGKEKPKPGCQVLESTPYGKSANVNNTGGEKIYITYNRADDAADSDSLAVVDIQVILPNRVGLHSETVICVCFNICQIIDSLGHFSF